jgi:hypothetical protein
MNPQRRPLAETLAAILARVGFFAAVHPLVHHQVILLGEAFGAVAASVRLHPRVNPVMYPQLVLLSEPFAAQVAQMLLLVGQLGHAVLLLEVPLQRRHLAEYLVAHVALIRQQLAFDSHPVVAHLVGQQVPGVGEIFVANHTNERTHPLVLVVVLFEQNDIVETLPARGADVVKLPQVDVVDVDEEAGALRGLVRALGAPEQLVVAVYRHVGPVVVRLLEFFLTNGTLEHLFVSLDVLLDLFALLVLRRTSVTNIYFLDFVEFVSVLFGDVLHGVSLAVLAQQTEGLESLVALLTRPSFVGVVVALQTTSFGSFVPARQIMTIGGIVYVAVFAFGAQSPVKKNTPLIDSLNKKKE